MSVRRAGAGLGGAGPAALRRLASRYRVGSTANAGVSRRTGSTCLVSWKTLEDKDKVLQSLTRDALQDMFRKTVAHYQDGKVVIVRKGWAPPCTKRTAFYRNVAADVALTMMRGMPSAFLDNDRSTRRFLQDAEGHVYDFETDRFYVNEPGIRVSLHLPWAFFPDDVWSAPAAVKQQINDFLDEVFDFWLAGDEPASDGKELSGLFWDGKVAAFAAFVMGCEWTLVWQLLLPLFEGSIHQAIYRLLHFAADNCAWARRTEWMYNKGEGSTGKDTTHYLNLTYFGLKQDDGYAIVLPSDYLTGKQAQGGLNPNLHECVHAHYIACNEIPADHGFFNFDAFKPLCEKRGSGVSSRTIYEKPEVWHPMGGVYLSGNGALRKTVKQSRDSGTIRRYNLVNYEHVFSGSLKDVKADIESGRFNAELFWLARTMYRYLVACPAGLSRIEPRPTKVVEDTKKDLEDNQVSQQLRDWIEANCVGARCYKESALATDIRAKMVKELSEDDGALELGTLNSALKEIGCIERRSGSRRVLALQLRTE